MGPTYEPTKEPTDPTGYPTGATAAPSSNPTAVRNGNQPVSNTPRTDSSSTFSINNISPNVIIFGVLAVTSCCLLTFCCVIILIYKKLSNESAFNLQQIQIAKDENRIIMSNALIANIVIGKYDDDTNAESSYLEVDSVINDMKQFANDFGYQYMPIEDRKYWTEQEILSFLRDDVGAEFFDENDTPKYDGLIVGITSYGDERDIMSSDGEVMDKVAIHRVISNQYAAIRDFPRIFIFDLCDVPESLKISMSMSAEHNEIHITNESDTHIVEMKEDDAHSVVDIGKNTDFEDVRQINEWTHNTKNPDYNLVTIDAVGDASTSNVIHCFAERVRLNVENQDGLGLTDVMDNIRADLRQRGGVNFVPVLNNKTPMMIITKKRKK